MSLTVLTQQQAKQVRSALEMANTCLNIPPGELLKQETREELHKALAILKTDQKH